MLIKEILFPRFCLGCGKLGKYICPACRQQLIFLDNQSCLYCQRASYMGFTHPQCTRQNGIDGLTAIFKYNNLLKKIIKTIKYRLATDILDELVFIAKKEVDAKLTFFFNLEVTLLFQPIPLHQQRLKERGFNQAQLIINKLKQIADISSCDLLTRVKNTSPQAQITDRKERFLNIQGAFEVVGQREKLIVHKAFFLVDDVVTSGSTVKEAARILKRYKATKVYVFSLAKGYTA